MSFPTTLQKRLSPVAGVSGCGSSTDMDALCDWLMGGTDVPPLHDDWLASDSDTYVSDSRVGDALPDVIDVDRDGSAFVGWPQ